MDRATLIQQLREQAEAHRISQWEEGTPGTNPDNYFLDGRLMHAAAEALETQDVAP
jgi:hypothetical protein